MPIVERGWYRKGKVRARLNYRKNERFHAFGALGENRIIRYSFYEEMNSDSLIHFLRRLKLSYRKLLLFFDRAPFHTSEKVNRFLLRNEKSVKYDLFPEKSPEMVPIEIEWREWRKLIGNKYFRDKEEMAEYLNMRIQSDDCPVICPNNCIQAGLKGVVSRLRFSVRSTCPVSACGNTSTHEIFVVANVVLIHAIASRSGSV